MPSLDARATTGSKMRRCTCTVVATLVTLTLLVAYTPAARAGEEELVVAPSLALSLINAQERVRPGGGLYLDVDYGLSDSWSLRGTGRYAAHYVMRNSAGVLSVGGLGFGVQYTFDVLKAVPFASLTAGASALGGANEGLRWNFDLALGIGADYLVSRSFSVGFEVRYHLLLPDIKRYPFCMGILIRLAWRRQ